VFLQLLGYPLESHFLDYEFKCSYLLENDGVFGSYINVHHLEQVVAISNRWSLYESCHHNLELTHYIGVSRHVLLDIASNIPPQTASIL